MDVQHDASKMHDHGIHRYSTGVSVRTGSSNEKQDAFASTASDLIFDRTSGDSSTEAGSGG